MDEPLSILYQALSTPLGLVVAVENYEKARAKLYQARAKDPSLACLQIRRSPVNPNGELWIVKNKQENPSE